VGWHVEEPSATCFHSTLISLCHEGQKDVILSNGLPPNWTGILHSAIILDATLWTRCEGTQCYDNLSARLPFEGTIQTKKGRKNIDGPTYNPSPESNVVPQYSRFHHHRIGCGSIPRYRSSLIVLWKTSDTYQYWRQKKNSTHTWKIERWLTNWKDALFLTCNLNGGHLLIQYC
jgi:hypothetical protein